jgi:hypothetical protein
MILPIWFGGALPPVEPSPLRDPCLTGPTSISGLSVPAASPKTLLVAVDLYIVTCSFSEADADSTSLGIETAHWEQNGKRGIEFGVPTQARGVTHEELV